MLNPERDRIKELLSEATEVPTDEIHDSLRLEQDLGVEGVTMLALAIDFEDEFAITINDTDFEQCTTVKELIDMIDELM